MNRNEFLKKKVEAEIPTKKLHYVKVPENLIVIDDDTSSRVFREIGQFVLIGLADGINKMDIKAREWVFGQQSGTSQDAKGGEKEGENV